jgi:hypothetical protein
MKDNINKAIIKGLCEAQKDDTSVIKSFIKKTEKIFHNKADVYFEGEYSNDPKVLIHLDEDCYQYWNEFVKKCLPMFTFDNIFPDYGTEFKYEDDGYFQRDGIATFGTVIYFGDLFDIEVDFNGNKTTILDVIRYYDNLEEPVVERISDTCGDQISKIFGGISDKEVEYLLTRLEETEVIP